MCIVIYRLQANVKTPKGNTVTAYTISSEWNEYWRGYYDSVYSQAYPNATIINTYGGYSSTQKMNCHGYAWHYTETNGETQNYRWIGWDYPTDEDIYWTGGSYTEVGSQIYPGGKVSYGSDDHSATVADPQQYGTGWFVSKCNAYVLMRHAYNDCPYTSTNLKYYKLNPIVSGSTNVLCYNVQRTFSHDITDMASATKTWSKVGNLIYVSQGATSYTVKGASGMGVGDLQFQITTPSGFTTTITKRLWVGIPYSSAYLYVRDYITKINNPTLCLYDDNYLEAYMYYPPADFCIDEFDWEMISGGYLYQTDPPFDVAIIQPYSSTVSLKYKAHNTCGWSAWVNNSLYAYYCGYYYSYSPNPVFNQLKIDAVTESGKAISDLQNDISVEFEAILYNSDKQIVKQGKSEDSKILIDIGDLNNGTYFLHIIDKAGNYDIIKEQIIIR